MHQYEDYTDKVGLSDANHLGHAQGSIGLFNEEGTSSANHTAPVRPSTGKFHLLPQSAMDDLDLNSQAPDMDHGMSFTQLLRSSSAAAIGDAEADVLRGRVSPLPTRGTAGLISGGRGRGVHRVGSVGPAASPSRTKSLATPAANKMARPYRPPRPSGASVEVGGGHRLVLGGPLDQASEDNEDSDHIDGGLDYVNESPWNDEKQDEGTKVALEDLEEMDEIGAMASVFGMYYDSTFMNKRKKMRTGFSGLEWVTSTLENPKACFDMFRMSKDIFYRLHDVLVSSYGLKSTKKMGSVEALAMFLWVVGAPQSVRQAENRFERSAETISRKFNEVLQCLYKLSADIVRPKDSEFKDVHPKLKSARYSHFRNCIGAIDGTHIRVIVPASKVLQHVGRHGYPTQNVLAICDFDMRFIFAVAGWPGSAHDMRVFNDAIRKYRDKFPHPPPGKFYLVDSGYPNRAGYLAPYRGTKYHLSEYRQGPRPSGKKEVFNYVHSSLRNVIERSFGVLKMKWRILSKLPSYPMTKQSKIILVCMGLHNFIRESAMRDADFDMCDCDENYMPMPPPTSRTHTVYDEVIGDEDQDMNAFRDYIADALFAERGWNEDK